jgi:hypothetical protein
MCPTTQGSFQQSLVEIGSVVSEEKIYFLFLPPFFLICIIGQNRQSSKFIKNPVMHVKKLIIKDGRQAKNRKKGG